MRIESLADQPSAKNNASETIAVWNELADEAEAILRNPSGWAGILKRFDGRANGGGLLWLDLDGFPLSRQFLSFTIRYFRRLRLFKGIAVVNASEEILTLLRTLERLQQPNEAEELAALFSADRDLGAALARGQSRLPLALLLPVCHADVRTSGVEIRWIGLSQTRHDVRAAFLKTVQTLGGQESSLSWEQVHENALAAVAEMKDTRPMDEGYRQELVGDVRALLRCNPGLFECTELGVNLRFNLGQIRDKSLAPLRDTHAATLRDPALFCPQHTDQRDFLFCFSWRPEEHRFRRYYYFTWPVLIDSAKRALLARLLIRQARSL